jgi:MarR family transcriptional regulator, organic hydroperoxide resistance regulator
MKEMTSVHRELLETALRLNQEFFHLAHAEAAAEWLRLDLTMAQVKLLFALAGALPLTVGGLAQQLGVTLAAASHLIDRLVQSGFVERYEDVQDRRRTIVRLTGEGAGLVARLRQETGDRIHDWFAALSADDLAALTQGLQGLLTAARAAAVSAQSRDG